MKDKCLKTYTIIGVFFVLAAGSLAHFLYDWTGSNAIAGLFVPVNESVWEHMKLLFFPMFLYSLIMIFKFKESHPCIISSLCFGILIGTLLIPVFFYTYTYILGKNIFILDISTFILSVIIAFLISYKFSQSCILKPYTFLLCILVGIVFICFTVFTIYPPDIMIFKEPAM